MRPFNKSNFIIKRFTYNESAKSIQKQQLNVYIFFAKLNIYSHQEKLTVPKNWFFINLAVILCANFSVLISGLTRLHYRVIFVININITIRKG